MTINNTLDAIDHLLTSYDLPGDKRTVIQDLRKKYLEAHPEEAQIMDYGQRLRQEKRAELARRALPAESFNEYGETFAVTKTEAGASFPVAAYAYTPDTNMPSTWKLRLWASPTGGPDAGIVGAAIAALGKGFRGNKVVIPDADLPAVKAKVKAAWIKANPDKDPAKDMPTFSAEVDELVACGHDGGGGDLSLHIELDDITVTPSQSLLDAFKKLVDAAQFSYLNSDVSVDVDIDADSKADAADEYDNSLEVDEDGLSQTPPDLVKAAFDNLIAAAKSEYGDSFELEVDIDVESNEGMSEGNDIAVPSYGYSSIESEEFGTLPPALAAQIVKKLQADLAKETDPAKKAEIQAKIAKFTK